MLRSREKFHSSNGRRLVLVADDEAVNREILGAVLENDYEVVYAADGQETLEQAEAYRDELSLVLLDLMMPVRSGQEVLQEMKERPELRHIPVIVLTADQNAEIESLTIGAIDYIPKPYPQAGIILARIRKAIELSEDREIIQSTERDPLTGLYNREYFYRYAEQYDHHHKEQDMDALVVDVNHFHMINERFGAAYGDEVLRCIGEKIRQAVADADGIVCRREADTFMIYCPHGLDYKTILDSAALGLSEEDSSNSRVRLRMGVYANVDKTLEIERRFDRAKLASDTVRNSFTRTIGVYDSAMHERELYAEQLIYDFRRALEEKQFKIYFQPKFDVRPTTPVLTSAEALVRWQHPTLGLISPGVFIPLFEDNGLIRELDGYIWRETAAQIRDWKERLGFTVPVSVNVSRIDMYDPHLIDTFESLLRDNDLEPGELLLELTESAYTQDSSQLVETAAKLRSMGFRIEMDDFGAGYSSLNMISALPIDALKLDMQFVRSAFRAQKDTRMLEVTFGIADRLSVPVIAEGVETEEQFLELKELGCDIVQGYYFSGPVSAEAFEPFLIERMGLAPESLVPAVPAGPEPGPITAAEADRPSRGFHLRAETGLFAVLALAVTAALILFETSVAPGSDPGVTVRVRLALAVVLVLAVLGEVIFITRQVRIPLTRMADGMRGQETVPPKGAAEVRTVTQTYNELLENSQRSHRQLSYEATHDSLTGLYNRGAYEMFMEQVDKEHIALLIVDVDEFKMINDTYGHDVGDRILKRVANVLTRSFRSVDAVCRLGGDEFVVVMTRVDSSMRQLVVNKISRANGILQQPEDGLPRVTLSVGAAFSDRQDSSGDIFKDADTALYSVKKTGRCGCAVYGGQTAPS